jgi:hypothetical protein
MLGKQQLGGISWAVVIPDVAGEHLNDQALVMSYLGTRSIPFAVITAVASGVIKNLTNALAVSGSLEPLLTPAVCTT